MCLQLNAMKLEAFAISHRTAAKKKKKTRVFSRAYSDLLDVFVYSTEISVLTKILINLAIYDLLVEIKHILLDIKRGEATRVLNFSVNIFLFL